jgi:hypothetical protein
MKINFSLNETLYRFRPMISACGFLQWFSFIPTPAVTQDIRFLGQLRKSVVLTSKCRAFDERVITS